MLGNCKLAYNIFIGEPYKERFEGIILSDAASEGNFIRSNGVFTAVISFIHLIWYFSRSLGNLVEVEFLQY